MVLYVRQRDVFARETEIVFVCLRYEINERERERERESVCVLCMGKEGS